MKTSDKAVRERRRALNVRPVYKRVGTCAAECATNTAYRYSPYEDECEAEPTIDYVVTKIPRFAFEKFPAADSHLTTQMKSVGEVMAMGRTFQESFQKALRGLEVGVDGMNEKTQDREGLEKEMGERGPDRICFVGDAFAAGWSFDEVHQLTKIDK